LRQQLKLKRLQKIQDQYFLYVMVEPRQQNGQAYAGANALETPVLFSSPGNVTRARRAVK
jgi:hypothetical protein